MNHWMQTINLCFPQMSSLHKYKITFDLLTMFSVQTVRGLYVTIFKSLMLSSKHIITILKNTPDSLKSLSCTISIQHSPNVLHCSVFVLL